MSDRSAFTTDDGSLIVYSDHGDGVPVLFLHGWLMSGKVWYFQKPLSDHFRVVTIDLRGHGDSKASDFSYDACVKDIAGLLTVLHRLVRADDLSRLNAAFFTMNAVMSATVFVFALVDRLVGR